VVVLFDLRVLDLDRGGVLACSCLTRPVPDRVRADEVCGQHIQSDRVRVRGIKKARRLAHFVSDDEFRV
jgi:hypothetical protein